MELEQKKTGRELKKHTSTIHCSNTLSLMQRKICNVLLFHAYPTLQERDEHKISIRELCQYLGYKSHNYQAIKDAIRALVTTSIEWNLTEDISLEEDWTISAFIASVRIKDSICSYTYSKHMRELLHKPSMYGKIDMLVQSNFSSTYSLALYENCIRYKGLPQTKEFSYELFRKLMGVSEGRYEKFKDFKKRVLDRAVDEVNTYSDIIVTPDVKRIGRQVVSIGFKIKEREKKKRLDAYTREPDLSSKSNKISRGLVDRLCEGYSLEKKQANSLIYKYGESSVQDRIDTLESSAAFRSDGIKNKAGYLIDMLKRNYTPNIDETVVSRIKQEEELHAFQLEREAGIREDVLRKKYEQYCDDEFSNIISAISASEYDQMLEAMKLQAKEEKNSFVLDLIKRKGCSNKIVQAHFRQFIGKHAQHLTKEIMSFEAFRNSELAEREES